jgi:O-acetyl-ADP-ribose deacetylase (regulator of RNase III)
MIAYRAGDLFASTAAEALVIPVNTVGVWGKGLARQAKTRWPNVADGHRVACRSGQVRTGRVWAAKTGQMGWPCWLLCLPTKRHWRDPSRLDWIGDGLADLAVAIPRLRIVAVAVPALGCGNGGLDWADVQPLIEAALGALADVDVFVYLPTVA